VAACSASKMGIVYTILNPVFSPLLHLGTIFAIIAMAMIINLIHTGLQLKFVDVKKMRALQNEMKEHRKKIMQSAKSGQKDQESSTSQSRMMEIQQELMKLQTPMFLTMVPIIFVFIWMREAFAGFGDVITLPYSLPIWGNSLGWLGWYILASFPISMFLRKLLRLS